MVKALLISEETLKKYTLVNENVDGKYLLSSINIAQEVDLDILIGGALNNKLQELVITNDIRQPQYADYKVLLEQYVTPFLCWQVMSTIQISINYKFTNSGVVEHYDDHKTRLSYEDSKALQLQYEKYANAYACKLKNFLWKNVSKYPEYTQCDNYETAEDSPLCNIYLGSVNRRNKTYIGK